MSKNRRAVGVVLAAMISLTSLLFGQSSPSQGSPSIQTSMDQDIDLMRKDIRSQKKQIIAANLQLTDKESEKFWPLYDQYTAELVKINDTKYGAIKDYAANYTTLTDDQAVGLTRKTLAVDQAVAQLRLRYIPIFGKVLSGKKTALFFQLDRRLVMLIDMQLASQVPLIQP